MLKLDKMIKNNILRDVDDIKENGLICIIM